MFPVNYCCSVESDLYDRHLTSTQRLQQWKWDFWSAFLWWQKKFWWWFIPNLEGINQSDWTAWNERKNEHNTDDV
jgi:hypothetical protein